ncbi:hypothetical protein O7598_10685 [Micromonospora sp. WMMC241]|uniref:hypothetical protein n=1 Tax=Micromonospora sp. WMMC241 TaxID=3015159 RepID=UPI0022B6040A|nr:hypothetical protein [Micromonospora sp. WMMC241]MCZ7436859.1 hypothetical protein [Micromonospora sp. WMMC241]
MRMRWAVQAVLVLVGIWLVPGVPAQAAPAETGRYYVVGPPVDGQREYLYAIALRTLGNGNRYREIVELNTGRAQPDGETFTDGLALNPGWVLVLPRDARGQGVRVGPLPRIRVRSAPPASRTPPSPRSVPPSTPPARSVAPSRTSAAPTRVPPSGAARPPATREVAAPPRREPTTPGGLDPLVIRVGAGVLSVLLAVVAIVLLRPGRSGRGAAVAGDDGPWPPERHHTPAPGDAARPEPTAAPGGVATAQAASAPARTGPDRTAVPAAPPPGPATGAVPTSMVDPTAAPAAPTTAPGRAASIGDKPGSDRPGSGEPRSAAPVPALATTAGEAEASPEPPVPVARPDRVPVDPATPVDLPRPPLPAAGELPYLTADLDTDVGPARVRLVGVAAGRGAPPYAWLGPGETTPPAVLPLVLGHRGPWRLHVDLARVPDVLTLVGPVAVCRRAAAALAGGLTAAGVGVAVVGDALGVAPPDGARRLPGLPEPPGPGDDLPAPCVVFTTGPPPAGARGLAAASGGRCVPVVLGPVPAGRWSLQLDADAPEAGGD